MRNLLLLLIVGVSGFTLWWLLLNGPETPVDDSGIVSNHSSGVGGISLGVIRIVERRESKTLFELLAQSAVVSEDQEEAALTTFSLLAYPGGSEPITFVAGHGQLQNKRSEVKATGGTVTTDQKGRVLLADSLTMYDSGERFETDNKVWIMGPNFAITGVGMVARPALKTVELKSNVTAVFKPGNR